MVARTLGGEGLSFHNGGDSLKVTRTLPVIRLRVTNHGPSVSAEWVTETRKDQGNHGNGLRRKGPSKFPYRSNIRPHPEETERGSMVLDEAVRYLLTPLLISLP